MEERCPPATPIRRNKIKKDAIFVYYKRQQAKVIDKIHPVQVLDNKYTGCSAARLAHLLWEQGVGGSNPLTPTNISNFGIGRLAQLGEHMLYTHVVGGSSPLAPTIFILWQKID